MQMIDVMKRLAELDAKNPQVVKESTSVAECGPMGMMDGMSSGAPSTPASINMTAGSGDELANMLATIMQLAGVKQVGDDDINGDEPSVLSATPVMGVDTSDGEDMRSVIDKLHPDDEESGEFGDEESGEFGNEQSSEFGDEDEEETDEGVYDNSPADPRKPPSFNPNQFSQNTNDGNGNTASGQRRTTSQPTATFETLMKEYKSFIGESAEDEETDEDVEEGMMDKIKSGAKTAAKAVGKAITGPDDEEALQRLEKQTGGQRPSHISTPVKSNESMADILKLSGLK